MELYLRDLVIEFSRKCNMNCDHCLRGKAQNKVIDRHLYMKLFSMVDAICSLTVGGGEPSLAVKQLEEFRWNSHDYPSIRDVFMCTNGKYVTKSTLSVFRDFFDLAEDLEVSALGFSFDRWHTQELTWEQEERRQRSYNQAHDYFTWERPVMGYDPENFVRKHSHEDRGYDSLLDIGNAKENGLGTRPVPFHEYDIDREFDNRIDIADNEVYLSLNGCLFSCCDLSYEEMDKREDCDWFICDINKIDSQEELIQAFEDYNERVAEEQRALA